MYERLSARLESIVKLAQKIAREFGQDYIGTEHLLLAILRDGKGLAAKALTSSGVTEEKTRTVVERLCKQSLEDTWVMGRLPGTPHYRNVIASAIEHAQKMGTHEVCTEHLLLALAEEKRSVASVALEEMGLGLETIRAALKAAIAERD